MYKKFLYLSYLGLMLCSLNTPGHTGRYTEAFEFEVTNNKCSRLKCDIINKGGRARQETYQGSVEVGHSEGPFGTTTHYKKAPLTRTYVEPDYFGCRYCEHNIGNYKHYDVFSYPKVTIKQKGNTRVMTIDETWCNVEYMCGKPSLDDDLAVIWEKAGGGGSWNTGLERMWEAARQLDEWEEDSNDMIYTVKKPSCIIQ